jgi:hypothetical protein
MGIVSPLFIACHTAFGFCVVRVESFVVMKYRSMCDGLCRIGDVDVATSLVASSAENVAMP